MKLLHTTLALLLTLGASLGLRAETYVRAGVGHFNFTNSAYEDHGGATLAVGTAFGARGSHRLELSVDLFQWKADWTPSPEVIDGIPTPPAPGGVSTDGDGHLLPVLIGYRYRTGTADSTWRFYAGADLGATRITGDVQSLQAIQPPYGIKNASLSSWRATAGVAVGVEFRLAPRFLIDVGYRFRAVDGPNVTLRVPTVPTVTGTQDMGSLSTSVFTAGCAWSF